MALSEKQKRFCEEYLIDLNGTQAATRAGYSAKTANEQAARLLAKVSVQAYVQSLQKKVSTKLEITRERILNELARIAFSDVRVYFDEEGNLKKFEDINDDQAAAVSSVETDELVGMNEQGEKARIGVTRKVKMWDKLKALESLAKYDGLFERDNSQKKPDQAPMTDQQVDRYIEALKSKK